MTEPYLILHKVRGEPAFDVATQLKTSEGGGAAEPVWIIPTSGHRAYPSWFMALSTVSWYLEEAELNHSLPDHYACNETPKPRPLSRVATTTDDFLV